VCERQSISPFTTEVAGHLISIFGPAGLVEVYTYQLATIGEEIGSALIPLDVSVINKSDLFGSFKRVVGLRQRYEFKCDDEVEDSERLRFQQSKKARVDALERGRNAYKQWRQVNRY
jgi:hypothetical protein